MHVMDNDSEQHLNRKHQRTINALVPILIGALSEDSEISCRESAQFFSYAGLGELVLSVAETQKLEKAAELLADRFREVSLQTIQHELGRLGGQLRRGHGRMDR